MCLKINKSLIQQETAFNSVGPSLMTCNIWVYIFSTIIINLLTENVTGTNGKNTVG